MEQEFALWHRKGLREGAEREREECANECRNGGKRKTAKKQSEQEVRNEN
jgi:hypothetical protein